MAVVDNSRYLSRCLETIFFTPPRSEAFSALGGCTSGYSVISHCPPRRVQRGQELCSRKKRKKVFGQVSVAVRTRFSGWLAC